MRIPTTDTRSKSSIGIEDTHHGYTVEVEALGNHLCTDKDVGAPNGEIVDDTFIGLTSTGGIEVHTGDMGLGEEGAHFVFDLLCPVTTSLKFMTATSRTLDRHLISIAAVVARELIQVTMEGEGYITVLAMRHPPTLFALNHRSIAATILEEDGLFASFQGLAYL